MARPPNTAKDHRPNERQAALLIAHLLATKQEEVAKDVTRARLTEATLQRLFQRQRITPDFLAEVQEWLYRAGWVLFFAGKTYAVIRLDAVQGWGRVSSKRIADALKAVEKGEFDFDKLESLFTASDADADAED